MKPKDLAAAIRKRGWMIIVIVILSALIAAIVARVQTPIYKAEITVSGVAPINPATKQPDSAAAGVMAYNFTSIANAMEGLDIAQAVSERLAENDINLSPEELLDKVKSEAEIQQSFARVTVTDESPTRVAEIANTWGTVLEEKASNDLALQDPNLKSLLLGGSLNVTNRAIPPSKASQPKPLVYLGLGVFVGLVLGFGLVLGIEFFDPHFRSAQEVEETLGIPVLGTIPKLKRSEAIALLSSKSDLSPAYNAYSRLRTTLMFSLKEKPFSSALIASTMATENSLYIPANLAISMAFTERETLLVDCDINERAVSKLFGAQDKPGLADSLVQGEGLLERIIKTAVPNLYLLPAGKVSAHSADLLSLPIMEEFLRELEDEFDKVIIHVPPLVTAIDGVIAASLVELSLVVIDAQKCTRNIALTAMDSFSHLHITPTGVVLSNVKISRHERSLYAQNIAPEPGEKRDPASTAAAAVSAVKTKKKAPEEPAAPEKRPTAPAAIEPPAMATTQESKPAKTRWQRTRSVAPETPLSDLVAAGAGEKSISRVDTPSPAKPRSTEDELQQMKDKVADDFHRLGATGAPIPKQWLRALNSDKLDVRDSARAAISAYYESFLKRYRIDDDSIRRITESIIKMMCREGEFATMSGEDGQKHLQKMLVDAGAIFSARPAAGGSGDGEQE